jgi:hypothetical protein
MLKLPLLVELLLKLTKLLADLLLADLLLQTCCWRT